MLENVGFNRNASSEKTAKFQLNISKIIPAWEKQTVT